MAVLKAFEGLIDGIDNPGNLLWRHLFIEPGELAVEVPKQVVTQVFHALQTKQLKDAVQALRDSTGGADAFSEAVGDIREGRQGGQVLKLVYALQGYDLSLPIALCGKAVSGGQVQAGTAVPPGFQTTQKERFEQLEHSLAQIIREHQSEQTFAEIAVEADKVPGLMARTLFHPVQKL